MSSDVVTDLFVAKKKQPQYKTNMDMCRCVPTYLHTITVETCDCPAVFTLGHCIPLYYHPVSVLVV